MEEQMIVVSDTSLENYSKGITNKTGCYLMEDARLMAIELKRLREEKVLREKAANSAIDRLERMS